MERIYLNELVLISTSLLLLSCCIIWMAPTQKRWRLGAISLLMWYVISVLCYTVFCRKMGELTQFQPMPFYNLFDGVTPLRLFIYEGLMNIIMFVPIGITAAFAGLNGRLIMLGALSLSLGIEAMQWFFRCGCCETNDIINNCIGAYIGILAAVKIRKYCKQTA